MRGRGDYSPFLEMRKLSDRVPGKVTPPFMERRLLPLTWSHCQEDSSPWALTLALPSWPPRVRCLCLYREESAEQQPRHLD